MLSLLCCRTVAVSSPDPRTTKSSFAMRIKAQILGWLVLAGSIALLMPQLIHRHMAPAPASESRRAPPKQKSEGAWWFTGAPAPAGQPVDLTGVWFAGSLGDISKAALRGQEMILTPFGKHKYETVDHSQNPTSRCLPPGPVRIMLMPTPMMIV